MIELLAMNRSASSTLYVDDVFSTYLYTGNGSTQTITNGIDLAGNGGLVWLKKRTYPTGNSTAHYLMDTVRGTSNGYLSTNGTNGSVAYAMVSAFNNNGFAMTPAATDANDTYASWTFRKAAKFFDQSTATVSGGIDATVSFSSLGTLGMVIVKRTDATGSWYVWHRSLTAGKLLYLEQTAAETTSGEITVSGTTVTLEGGVIANGDYIVYGFAHDTGTDGIIQCGSFTTDGSGNATVSLGWEPQFVMLKSSGSVGNWISVDNMRAFSMTSAYSLSSNLSNAESTGFADATYRFHPTANGFQSAGALSASTTYIYLAIRRPNKPPTSGTQVYNAVARTGTGVAATVTGVGFAPDLALIGCRASGYFRVFTDKLRGAAQFLTSTAVTAEATRADAIAAFLNDGASLGVDASGDVNQSGPAYINHFFRRAPGVFDVVCDNSTTSVARTIQHNLGVPPELIISKGRNIITDWPVMTSTKYLRLNTTNANLGAPIYHTFTATSFSIDAGAWSSGENWVAYLFATKAGISKVGSYTGNGTNQTINCGFSGGARFILIKRTDSTGDWYVWDTVRGIVAGNDPHLSLNTTAAEVTTDDSIDTASSGFIVNQDAATNINVNTATYIFLAFA